MTCRHIRLMAGLASLSHSVGQPISFDDPLKGDYIGYDAWLLPPEELEPAERMIRLCSRLAGPLIFVAELACFIYWIF
jgi:hypothetical protein